MKKYIFFLGLALLYSCEKELKTTDIIKDLKVNPVSVDADGASGVSVSVSLSDKSATDKRNIVFTATSGSWVGGQNGKVTIPATYQNGQIIAKATLNAPASAGTITITAASESLTINGDYMLTAKLEAVNVPPAAIHLEPTSLGIGSNYAVEDTLTAKISGAKGNNASKGVKVIFEDLLVGGAHANGHFRAVQTTSNNSSTVSTIYGAAAYPPGTPIQLKVTILDDKGIKTAITDVITLTIK